MTPGIFDASSRAIASSSWSRSKSSAEKRALTALPTGGPGFTRVKWIFSKPGIAANSSFNPRMIWSAVRSRRVSGVRNTIACA